jgi:hypothetical protein
MDFALGFVRGLYLIVFSCCIVFFLRRFLWRWRKRRGKRNPGFYPTYASAGNAIQALQAMAQPTVEYVLEEKLEDQAEDDDNGEPDTPEKLLHRQLRQIRRGEKVERLTVLRRSRPSSS